MGEYGIDVGECGNVGRRVKLIVIVFSTGEDVGDSGQTVGGYRKRLSLTRI